MSCLIHEITTFAHDDANDWILFQQCCEPATPDDHTADQLKREPEQVLFFNEDDHQVDNYEDDDNDCYIYDDDANTIIKL